MTPRAAEILELEVVLAPQSSRTLRGLLSVLTSALSFGDDTPRAPREVVLVRRKDTRRVIAEIPEGWGDTVEGVEPLAVLLARDLETLTPEEFCNAWGLDSA